MKILYLDMDGVLVDFGSAIPRIPPDLQREYADHLDDVPGLFALMEPLPDAIEAFMVLVNCFDTYILTTAPWKNPSTWTDKAMWVQRFLGEPATKRLIITHHKELNRGDFLVDDRTKWGAGQFMGEHLLFGSERFPDWRTVLRYLLERAVDADGDA